MLSQPWWLYNHDGYMGGGGGGFLCWPCWDAHPGIHTPTLIPHCSSAPRRATSGHWWGAIWRKPCIATRSLGWGSDSTYAGHHLLYPPLTTILVKSRESDQVINSIESRPLLCPLIHQSSFVDSWRLWPELPKARKEVGTSRLRLLQEHGRSWYLFIFNIFLCSYTWG